MTEEKKPDTPGWCLVLYALFLTSFAWVPVVWAALYEVFN